MSNSVLDLYDDPEFVRKLRAEVSLVMAQEAGAYWGKVPADAPQDMVDLVILTCANAKPRRNTRAKFLREARLVTREIIFFMSN